MNIHFNNKEKTEMTVDFYDEYKKVYFLSVNNYKEQLFRTKCPHTDEIEKEIKKFLEK
jgi:hypothetical protein